MLSTLRRLAGLTALLALALTGTAAAADYHPSTLLVSFQDGTPAAQRAAAHGAVGGRVANRFAELNTDVVRLPKGLGPQAARDRYNRLPGVQRAALNHEVRLNAAPNDPLFRDQWGFHNTGQRVTGSLVSGRSDFDIDAPEGWAIAFPNGFEGSGGAKVAIIDTGIDRTHVDLLNRTEDCATATTALGIVTEGTCSDDNLHGTHVAGTVAAHTNNGLGVAGTAPNGRLSVFKALNAAGVGFYADIIAGVRWVARLAKEQGSAGPRVLSMSYGSTESDDLEQQALKDAQAQDVLLVAAAGNDGDSTRNYPAYYPEVMSVASFSQDGGLSWFSTCNNDTEIAAPGEDIWSTFPANGYGVISGTSMATPHVSGAAALLRSEQPSLSAGQTRSQLKSGGVSQPTDRSDKTDACPSSLPYLNLAGALGGTTTTSTTETSTTDGDSGSTKPGNGKGSGTKTQKQGSGRPS